jgi:hypothetical protein
MLGDLAHEHTEKREYQSHGPSQMRSQSNPRCPEGKTGTWQGYKEVEMGAFLFVFFYIFILMPLAGAIDNAIAIRRLERERRKLDAPRYGS